jgi:hypothetical protein
MLHLTQALQIIAEKATQAPLSPSIKAAIQGLIERNDLAATPSVPTWLLEMLTKVAHQQSTPWVSFPDSGYNYSNVFTLLTELDEVVPVHFVHQEEQLVLHFKELSVEVVISLEANQYKVTFFK